MALVVNRRVVDIITFCKFPLFIQLWWYFIKSRSYIGLSGILRCWLLVLIFLWAVAFFSIITYLVVVIILNVLLACWVLLSYVELYRPYILPIYCRFLIRLPGICLIPVVVLSEVSRGIVLSF